VRTASPEYTTAPEHQVRDDVAARRLVPTALDWPQTFADACELSASHTPTLLTRSLDFLHVAAARALDCAVFVSADDRQLAAATAAGLKAVDIERATARSPRR